MNTATRVVGDRSGQERSQLSKLVFDPKVRGLVAQAVVGGLLVLAGYYLVSQTIYNMEKRGLTAGFDFLWTNAGFDVGFHMVDYQPTDTFSKVFLVGAINTLTIYDVAALRFGIAAICVVPFLGKVRWSNLTWPRACALATIGGAVFALFLLGGFVFAPVADGGIVVNGAMPVFAALMSWAIFGEGLGRWRVAGIILIVIGVLATGWDALEFGVPGQWRGHLLFLGAAACNAGFLTAVRGWRIGALESLVAVMGLNGLIYLPIWWLLLPSTLLVAPWQEIALQGVYQGIIAALIAGFMIARSSLRSIT